MTPKNVLYYGTEEPLPERTPLRAGPLEMIFERGDLRYIRLGGNEILRRVYVAIRDRNWGTVAGALSNLSIRKSEDEFEIRYESDHRQGEIHFRWSGTITGARDGMVTFSMDGKALTSFLRNRIGFCVLHPIRECAGRPCTVEKADGSTERGVFPRYVASDQPFLDIRAISHEVEPGVTAEVRFSGEVFEMEDHRNWCDASYKTYGTPLRLPFPVEVKAGTEIRQSVRLSLCGKPAARATGRGDAVEFTIAREKAAPLPRIGLSSASHGQPLSSREIALLKVLNLAHLRVDLNFSADYDAALRRATSESKALGVPLEVAVTLSDSGQTELEALLGRLRQVEPRVVRWLIFHASEKSTPPKWVRLARDRLSKYDPRARIASGTNVYFTELNRDRPHPSLLDEACFSVNPQVHAFDNASLVENAATGASIVESARQFLGRVPIVVSPVTFKPRFNPDATGPEPPPAPGELPPQVDPRQMSLFGAAWTLASVKYFAESGVASLTYFETTGWRGVMETAAGSPLPERFRSRPGAVFPMYHVFADLGEFTGAEVLPAQSSLPLAADGLALRKDGRLRILLASFSPEPQPLRLRAEGLGRRVWVERLDETIFEQATSSSDAFRAGHGEPLEVTGHWLEFLLRPFGILRIDSGG